MEELDLNLSVTFLALKFGCFRGDGNYPDEALLIGVPMAYTIGAPFLVKAFSKYYSTSTSCKNSLLASC
tara:strand:- start:907 stop:1113 length:207 start_codon:yes stop_codon:yes gene_type:complete